MTDWYYHEPGQGRTGPLSAEQLRKYFRERRIDTETLVWHEGLREWQPLERLRVELDLLGVMPDTTLPPPLPAKQPLRMVEANASQPSAANASAQGRHHTPPPANNRGCLIAAIVVGGLVVVAIALLAALALPAYQDYVKRSRQAQQGNAAQVSQFDAERMADTEALARQLIGAAMIEYYAKNNYCPDVFEFDKLQVRHPRLQGNDQGWFRIDPTDALGSQCAYEVAFYGLGPEVADKPLRYEAVVAGEETTITCYRHQLPPQFVPSVCKN